MGIHLQQGHLLRCLLGTYFCSRCARPWSSPPSTFRPAHHQKEGQRKRPAPSRAASPCRKARVGAAWPPSPLRLTRRHAAQQWRQEESSTAQCRCAPNKPSSSNPNPNANSSNQVQLKFVERAATTGEPRGARALKVATLRF